MSLLSSGPFTPAGAVVSGGRTPRPRSAVRAGLVALAGALALVGCTPGAETAVKGARVVVTDGFGGHRLIAKEGVPSPAGATALGVLERTTRVTLAPDRRTLRTVDGRSATPTTSWSYWINGLPAETGPLDEKLPSDRQRPARVDPPGLARVHDGDVVWFDRHGGSRAVRPRGVVGSFPEPFLHGSGGKRYPLRVECVKPRERPCRMVRDALVRYGIPVATTALRSSYNPETARIAVGTWSEIREDPAAGITEEGVAVSGVFARPHPDGRAMDLLGPQGHVARTLGAGTGLVFASRYRDEAPSWAVTGTDPAGLLEAAGALDQRTLADRLAVAVRHGQVTGLPVTGR